VEPPVLGRFKKTTNNLLTYNRLVVAN
jgi:hypothetical protein